MPRLVCVAALMGLLAAGCNDQSQRSPGLNSSVGGSGGSTPHDASAENGGAGGTSDDGGLLDGDTSDVVLDGAPDDAPTPDGAGGADGASILCYEDPAPASGDGYCVQVDGDGYQCDPITSSPCHVGSGETCEFDGARFVCVNAGASGSAPCGVCGVVGSDYCTQGFTCRGLDGKCTRYCCDDYQCAFGAHCVLQPPTSVGICQAKADNLLAGFVGGSAADGGAEDAGHDAAPPPTECNVTAPLGTGACVPVGSPGFPCNPITNAGCDAAAGEACDLTGYHTVSCVTGSHNLGACQPCTTGECQQGLTCEMTSICAKFCCEDAECGQGVCAMPMDGIGPGKCIVP